MPMSMDFQVFSVLLDIAIIATLILDKKKRPLGG